MPVISALLGGRSREANPQRPQFPECMEKKRMRFIPKIPQFFYLRNGGNPTLECPKTLQKQAVRKSNESDPHDFYHLEKQECKWKIIFLLAKVLVTSHKVADLPVMH